MRRHGWQLPYHPLQVVAVAVFLALGFAFYVFFAPFVGGKPFQYAVMGLYTPLVVCVFVLYIWCAAMDPSDPGVFKSKKYLRFCNSRNHSIPKERKFDTVPSSRKNDANGPVKASEKAVDKIPDMDNTDNRSCSEVEDKPKFIHALSICMALSIWCPLALPQGLFCSHEQCSEPQTSEDGMFYCSLCKVEVFKYSKHCRVCDKCVDGFDHHCRWINNCIGRKNYRRFFTLMMSSLLLLIVQWSIGILVLICCFLERKRFALEITTKLGSSFSLVPFVIVVASCTFLAILATLPLAQLFCFHVLLIKKGISTYDYIIALREQEQLATGDQQSAQMSPVSSLTGLSSVSSFNTYHHGAWCTPPRLFLEDQFDVVSLDAGISSSSKKLHYDEPSNKRSNGSLKINPWTLARLNTEEVSKATEQARKKSKILQPVGKRASNKRGRFPVEPVTHLSSKASADDLMVVCNDNDSVAEPSTSLAPLQLEARSAFRTSRAMSAVGMVASSPDSSLDSPDLHPYRQSSSGVEHSQGIGALAAADAQKGVNFSRSTSDGYEPSGGEDSDQIRPRTLHRASNWDGFVLGSGHLNSRVGSMNSHQNERFSKSRQSLSSGTANREDFSRFVA